MRSGPAHETAAARPFAELELLNGPGYRTAFAGRKLIRIAPGQCGGAVAIPEEMVMPTLERGRNWSSQGCHGFNIKYFVTRSQ
jgi:hypothetical protein